MTQFGMEYKAHLEKGMKNEIGGLLNSTEP